MFEFNDILTRLGIDPATVLIMRHRPPQKEFRRQLPWLAAEKHEIFNAYQQVQPRVEKAMQRAKFVASFIAQNPAEATFVDLYEIANHRILKADELGEMQAHRELEKLGVVSTEDEYAGGHLYFDLVPTGSPPEAKGRLICSWPPPDRSWYRWADRNRLEISALTEASRLAQEMPPWGELVLSKSDLDALPRAWSAALSQWRGIYFVLDETDGRGYVGSAYGNDNIYGRWRVYASNGHGGNVGLKNRAGNSMRFSILQRVSPDMEPADVIARENAWKIRLHTREFGLNRN